MLEKRVKEDKLARWKKGATYYGTSCPIHAEKPCMCRLKGIEIMLLEQKILQQKILQFKQGEQIGNTKTNKGSRRKLS